MSDLNWCTFCDMAIHPYSKSLYCSDQCLRADALRNHPLLGYTYPDCIRFVRRSSHNNNSSSSHSSIPVFIYNNQSPSSSISFTSSNS